MKLCRRVQERGRRAAKDGTGKLCVKSSVIVDEAFINRMRRGEQGGELMDQQTFPAGVRRSVPTVNGGADRSRN